MRVNDLKSIFRTLLKGARFVDYSPTGAAIKKLEIVSAVLGSCMTEIMKKASTTQVFSVIATTSHINESPPISSEVSSEPAAATQGTPKGADMVQDIVGIEPARRSQREGRGFNRFRSGGESSGRIAMLPQGCSLTARYTKKCSRT